MSLGIIGRKCGMTRVFTEDGVSIPVTVIQVEPNVIAQVTGATSKSGFHGLAGKYDRRGLMHFNAYSSLYVHISESLQVWPYFCETLTSAKKQVFLRVRFINKDSENLENNGENKDIQNFFCFQLKIMQKISLLRL